MTAFQTTPEAAAERVRSRGARLLRAMWSGSLTVVLLVGCAAPSGPRPATSPGACSTGSESRSAQYAPPSGQSFSKTAADADGRVVRLKSGTVAFQNFTPAEGTIDGGVITSAAAGLIGAGPARTVLEVAAGSSTHAGDIPTTFPSTNQLSVLRVGGTGTVLRGFSVRGTEQGHLYNGLRVERVRDLRAADISVTSIPGGAASPPGETFGINDFRTTGSNWSHILVDGAGVGASGFGVNNASSIRICDTASKRNRFGMGFAFWQSSGIRCVDCTATDNGRAGFNFERISGSNTFIRPIATGNAYAFRISSDQGSARFRIVDPRLTDGRFTVTLPFRYNGAANRQKAADITLIVDGVRRRDLLRIERY